MKFYYLMIIILVSILENGFMPEIFHNSQLMLSKNREFREYYR